MSDETDRLLKKAKEGEALRQDLGLDLDVLRERCTHSECLPQFDVEAAKTLGAHEIRKRYPRFNGKCPNCGAQVICYASTEHYLMGDW